MQTLRLAAYNDPIDMASIQQAQDAKIDMKGFALISFTLFTAAMKGTEALALSSRLFCVAFQDNLDYSFLFSF